LTYPENEQCYDEEMSDDHSWIFAFGPRLKRLNNNEELNNNNNYNNEELNNNNNVEELK
jgi:hypothetical protein